ASRNGRLGETSLPRASRHEAARTPPRTRALDSDLHSCRFERGTPEFSLAAPRTGGETECPCGANPCVPLSPQPTMPRPITLFTGQWADLPLAELAPLAKKMGYDGVELACWGDHFDVDAAAASKKYVKEKWELLA